MDTNELVNTALEQMNSDPHIKKPDANAFGNRLLIKGIKPAEFQILRVDIGNEEEVERNLPQIFTNTRTWPRSLKLRCLHCTLWIREEICFIPDASSVIVDDNGIIIKARPIKFFNSWNCALSYVNQTYTDHEKKSIIFLLYELAALFRNKRPSYIMPAPDKSCLREYGGCFTSKEYMEQLIISHT